MTDEETLAQFGVALVLLHAIAEATEALQKASDDLYRRELLGGLPTDKDLMYEAPETD